MLPPGATAPFFFTVFDQKQRFWSLMGLRPTPQLIIENKHGIKQERRTVTEEIHYNPDAPDFLDQLRWHGYKTECETEKDVFMYFYVYLD